MRIKNSIKKTINFLLIVMLLITGANAISTEGLVAYYPFDGNANDESGNGNHGVASGTTLTTDKNNNNNSAYEFDGTNDDIKISNFNIASNEYTISMWAKSDVSQIKNDWNLLFRWADDAGSDAGFVYFSGWENNQLDFGVDSSNGQNHRLSHTQNLGTNWHHYVFTFKENNMIKIFIDGELKGNKSVGTNSYLNSNENFVLGSRDFLNHDGFDGKMDEIRIYDRVLNSSEINDLYLMDSNNCPISDGQIVNESITFDAGTICNLPNGFSIIGEALNMTCNGAQINTEDIILINASGSFSNCGFSGPKIIVHDRGSIDFTNTNFDFINVSIDAFNVTFLNSTLNFSVLIKFPGGTYEFPGLNFQLKIPTGGHWKITWPNVTISWPNGLEFVDIVGIDNITLDCNNGIINGSGLANSTGIFVNTTTDVTIKNCIIQNYGTNVKLINFDGDSFINNTLRYAVNQNLELHSASNSIFKNINIYK